MSYTAKPHQLTPRTFGADIAAQLFPELSRAELGWLRSSRPHVPLLATRRAALLGSRVRLLAALLAVLTPLWVLVEIVALPRQVWLGLAVGRLIAALAFMAILVFCVRFERMEEAMRALVLLFAICLGFYVFSFVYLTRFELSGTAAAMVSGYAFLPFVLAAGLSLFPLTLFEGLLFALSVLVVQALAGYVRGAGADAFSFMTQYWLLAMLCGVGLLASLSQLGFVIALVQESIRDALTRCFSRNSGEELLASQFSVASRADMPLAVAFVDVDHFKRINDRFGHRCGDDVLKTIASRLHSALRASDMIARWGGEEFIVVMPNTSLVQAHTALDRMRAGGVATTPDGNLTTVSIGIAERGADNSASWQDLVERADHRMYRAKQNGRNGIVAGD